MSFVKSTLAVCFFFLSLFLSGQQNVRGKVRDAKDSTAIPGVQAVLLQLPDSTFISNTQTDSTGRFSFEGVNNGNYCVKLVYIGYRPLIKSFEVADKPVFLRGLTLTSDAHLLKEVNIESVQVRQEQKGDTTVYNAGAFKVAKDANVEDLVKKMPGVTIENGTVKHQGEDVKKVLIDGKEFFGDDANIALKNLPAEMVDNVQVFDRSSDQSFYSGFDDGNSQKTMNIKTKSNKSNGTFGNAYAGYGTDERYKAGLNLNSFKGDRRFSVIAMTNNINQQNFSTQDLLNVTGSQGGGRGGPRGGMQNMGRPGGSGGPGGYGNFNNAFSVGNQGGINITHSAGVNYSDRWGKKVMITGSYFYNYTDNNANSTLIRNYFSSGMDGQHYEEAKTSLSDNQNHRVNFRMEYMPDTMHSIVFNPRISLQNNQSSNGITGFTSLSDTITNETNSSYVAGNTGFTSNSSLLIRRRFKKIGRGASLQLNADVNDKSSNALNYSLNRYYYEAADSLILIDQETDNLSGGNNFNASLSYTEPLNKNLMLQFSYNPAYEKNIADKKTFDTDTLTDAHSRLDTTLSNEFDNIVITQKGGMDLRYSKENLQVFVGASYQYATLQGDQRFPYTAEVRRNFLNVLPNVSLRYRFTKNSNLRMNYRTRTSMPSVSQLQDVIDNSNTLILSGGNPNLRQNLSHFMMARYNVTNPKTSRGFFFFIMGNIIQDYIANSTVIAGEDTTLSGGVILRKGSQFNSPVNLNGNWTIRSFSTYSTPIKKLKSTLNINIGVSYANLPGLINYVRNVSSTTSMNTGIVIASNISEKLDFTLSWNGNYNVVTNTIQTSGNNNYLFHLTAAKLNWNFYKDFHLQTDFNYTHYDGLKSNFNQKYILWNNALAYKFLKNKSAELRFNVYDVLKQNNSVGRNVTETYIEDTETATLQRYYMMTFTYTFRKFAETKKDEKVSPLPENEKK